ncbi:MAG: metalloprotease PmbA [Kangiellaceae bacterium]
MNKNIKNLYDKASADNIDLNKEKDFFHASSSELLEHAKKLGASQAEFGFSKDIGLSVSVRNQTIETLEYNRDNSCGISVYFGNQKGNAATSDLSLSSLKQALEAACNIAKYTQPDPFTGLADKNLMATKAVDLNLDHPMLITAEKAKRLALECEGVGLNYSDKITNSEGASFSSHRNIHYYANSHGFSAITPSTRHSLSCVLLAEGANGKQRDYWYSAARDSKSLESGKVIGSKAAKRTLARLDSRKISTQKAKVLFVPEMARTLIGHFKSAINGTSVYRESSFLLNKLDQTVFPAFFNLQEKPFIQKGLASAWHDSEGVSTKEQFIVENGILNTYLLNSYSARKLKMNPTGHAGGTHNLHLKDTGQSFEQLIKELGTGLIVTEMMGQGVNAITGDYSRGASGFWVENGEIQHFVEEITIAGNLLDMFTNLVAIGNDFDYRSSIVTGSWLIPEMTIAAG